MIRIFVLFLLSLTSLINAQEENTLPGKGNIISPHTSSSLPQTSRFITIGSTKEEVFAVQGTPKSIQKFDSMGEESWTFNDYSSIRFKDGRVHEWNNNGLLNVTLNAINPSPQIVTNDIQQQIDNFASQTDANGKLTHPNFKKDYQEMISLLLVHKAGTLQEAYDQAQKIQVQVDKFAIQKDEDGDLKHPDFEKFRPEMGIIMTAGQPKTMEEAYDQAQELHEQMDGFTSLIEESGNLEYPDLDKVRPAMGVLITAGHVNTLEDAYDRVVHPYKESTTPYSTARFNSVSPNTAPSGIYSTPGVAENGSYYGQTSKITGLPKTTHVRGYYRKNGTYVRGHYRSHK